MRAYSEFVADQAHLDTPAGAIARGYVASRGRGGMNEIYTTASGFRRAALRILDADPEGLDALEDAYADLESPGVSAGQPAPYAGSVGSTNLGVWLSESTTHSDPAIAHLATWWATYCDGEPAATAADLAYVTRKSFRASAALERAVVGFNVQHTPAASHVGCGECHQEAGYGCRDRLTGRPLTIWHRDRRRNADSQLHQRVAHDLRTIHAARRTYLSTNPSTTK